MTSDAILLMPDLGRFGAATRATARPVDFVMPAAEPAVVEDDGLGPIIDGIAIEQDDEVGGTADGSADPSADVAAKKPGFFARIFDAIGRAYAPPPGCEMAYYWWY